jgi:hypothetical protein
LVISKDVELRMLIAQNMRDGGVIISTGYGEGAKVNGTYRLPSIILGDFGIGSILDPLANFILNSATLSLGCAISWTRYN